MILIIRKHLPRPRRLHRHHRSESAQGPPSYEQLIGDAPATDWVVNIRYVDRLEKRNDEWRIADRMVVLDSERIDPVASSSAPLSNPQFGRRDRSDPSYKYDVVA